MYDYDLPENLIAHTPAEPRDAARLLVYRVATNEIIEDVFANISRYIPEHSLLVLNDTRVIPARLELTKSTGGIVRILFLVNESGQRADSTAVLTIKGLPDRKLKIGEVLFCGAGKYKGKAIVRVLSQVKEEFTFEVLISMSEFRGLLEMSGKTPLPPYIHSSLSEEEIRARYQTVFAGNGASVAAPTASLHFTDKVFQSLAAKDITKTYVTLHVGRGTFSPVDEETIQGGKLHEEPIHIENESAQKIAQAKKEGRMIVAAGTTATRVLESAAQLIMTTSATIDMSTSIFIKPPYQFQLTDALITNFHLPNTSLLMLLDALLQYRGAHTSWRKLYEYAITHKFRFYSFGDAMLVI